MSLLLKTRLNVSYFPLDERCLSVWWDVCSSLYFKTEKKTLQIIYLFKVGEKLSKEGNIE